MISCGRKEYNPEDKHCQDCKEYVCVPVVRETLEENIAREERQKTGLQKGESS